MKPSLTPRVDKALEQGYERVLAEARAMEIELAARARNPLGVKVECPNGCKAGIEGVVGVVGPARYRCLKCDRRWIP